MFKLAHPPLRCTRASFYMLKGFPTGGNGGKGQKWKGAVVGTATYYSVSYLTLTAGDKSLKCPSVSPKQCEKGLPGTPRFATMVLLSAPLATARRWLHSLPPRTPGRAPERHVGGCAGARARRGGLPRQAPCRGRCLVASGSLSLTGPCRGARCAAASSLQCLGWPSRQAPLAGVLGCFC